MTEPETSSPRWTLDSPCYHPPRRKAQELSRKNHAAFCCAAALLQGCSKAKVSNQVKHVELVKGN